MPNFKSGTRLEKECIEIAHMIQEMEPWLKEIDEHSRGAMGLRLLVDELYRNVKMWHTYRKYRKDGGKKYKLKQWFGKGVLKASITNVGQIDLEFERSQDEGKG
jgi:hypothetical protein